MFRFQQMKHHQFLLKGMRLYEGTGQSSEKKGGGAHRMNSLSHEVAILPLSGIIIIITTTQTPLFFQE